MIVVNLILFFYSALFLTTAIDKILDLKGSIIDVKNYNILPNFMIKPFLFTMIFTHILVSFGFLFSYMVKYSLILSSITLLVYTIAIIINLINDNKIACGCNGMVGNNIISWKTVFRNIVIILGISIIYWFKPKEFSPIFLFYFLVYLELYVFYKLFKEFYLINKKVVG